MTNGRRGERTKGRIYRACLNSTSDVAHTHLTAFPIIVRTQKEVQKEVTKGRRRLLPRPRLQAYNPSIDENPKNTKRKRGITYVQTLVS